MKLHYKKIILLVLISTMGIGVLTLALSPNHHAKESMKYSNTQKDKSPSVTAEVTAIPTVQGPTAAPTLSPTPAVLPVYDLKSKGYPEIAKLMKAYYKAKLDCSIDKLKALVSDPDNIPTKKKLKKEAQFFDEYRHLKCYVKKGYAEGTYIVFTYYDIKITNIKTLVPALTENYVITQDDGSMKIIYGKLDDRTNKYYKARKKDSDVKKLKKKVNTKFKKALKKDKTLKTFYKNLMKAQSK